MTTSTPESPTPIDAIVATKLDSLSADEQSLALELAAHGDLADGAGYVVRRAADLRRELDSAGDVTNPELIEILEEKAAEAMRPLVDRLKKSAGQSDSVKAVLGVLDQRGVLDLVDYCDHGVELAALRKGAALAEAQPELLQRGIGRVVEMVESGANYGTVEATLLLELEREGLITAADTREVNNLGDYLYR